MTWALTKKATDDNTAAITKTIERVGLLEQTVAVQTAMLSEIKDTVKEIARSQRRRRDE